jgi:predicted ATPase
VNILEHLVQQGLVVRQMGQWTLRGGGETTLASLPEGLRQFLVRRIEDLRPEVRRVLEAASTVGEAFPVAAVAAGVQSPVEEVNAVCEALVAQHHFIADVGLVVWPDGTQSGQYRFQHALYQQVLYERLGTMQRMQLHQRVGARLEVGYGGQGGEMATQLAVHFERGGEISRAMHYWQQVGDNAVRRHAHHEAIAALRKALALLATLPDSRERMQHELTLQLSLGEAVSAAEGRAAPEVGEAYSRAHVLCEGLGEVPLRFQVLQGLYRFQETQAQLHAAGELAQQLAQLAQEQHDAGLLQEGQSALGSVAFYRGDLVAARAYLEPCLPSGALYPPAAPVFRGGHHLGVTNLTWMVLVLWGLGYADQAQRRSQEALALAQQVEHPPTLTHAQIFATILSQCRRDAAVTYACADALMTFAAAQGLAYRVAQGRFLRGWAQAMQGDAAAGVAQIQQGIAAAESAGLKLFQPYRLALLAEAYGKAGQPEAGLTALAEALTIMADTGERWREAELHRLKGALLLQLPAPDDRQAEACFLQALAVARSQQAKSLELQAALSLSRLWQRRGQRAAARDLLAPIYGWFTEGFDTPDLREAQALLDAH